MTTPDLTVFRIMHRAMRGDLHRLVKLARQIEADREHAGQARATAIAGFAADICKAIHHHHTREDEVVWPLIERSAGAAVDLTDLSDDHAELGPLLDRLRATAQGFAAGQHVAEFGAAVRELSEHLDEHIEEEERKIFPIIEKYVSVPDWQEMEKSLRKGGDIRFELGWVDQYATPQEMAHIRKAAGLIITIMIALMRPGHRRRHRLLFGG
ncbi:hemerythrin domain-containing protein [Nonomuraea basaltis]|uniref:hemerythrin domain-containing protein n=1 Tax=Nonomuraea basaltis TaxID=2495887 RepID=UPI001F0F9390|nr:hemerythrin domain-containing protein [Nonomuraea basaltis]